MRGPVPGFAQGDVNPSAEMRAAQLPGRSKADMCSAQAHVRFTPESGHVQYS